MKLTTTSATSGSRWRERRRTQDTAWERSTMGQKATLMTELVCPCSVVLRAPVPASHSLILRSPLPEAMVEPQGLNATLMT